MNRARRSMSRNGALPLAIGGWLAIFPVSGQSLPPAQTIQQTLNRSTTVSPTDSITPDDMTGTGATPLADVTAQPGGILHSRLPVQLGLTAGGYYDDNIYVQPDGGRKVSDYIWSLSPLIAWNSAAQTGVQNSIQLAYAPALIFYQDQTQNDTLDEAANATYGFEDGRTRLTVSEAYSTFQESNADYGNLTMETSSITAVTLDYQLTAKTSLDLFAQQVFIQDDPGLRSTEWTQSAYLTYDPTPKTSFGLGGLVGVADLQGPNQTYEQVNGRVNYDPDTKLSFNLTAGLEFRETEDHGGANVTPDFSLGLAYQPFDGTNAGLNAYRRYEYSGRFFGDDYLATGVSAFVSQRFVHKFYLILSGAFENAQYRDNFSDSDTGQGYNYLSIRPELAYTPVSGCELKIFYQYRDNLAHGGIASFTDDQLGFSAAFTY
jgi:hypothetical protein